MAWQYPTHKCGHSGERYQAYGPGAQREKQLAAIEARPCPACRAEAAQLTAQATGLPALVGSDKQRAWGGDIRARVMLALPAVREQVEIMAEPERAKYSTCLSDLTTQAEARWWIDNRTLDLAGLLRAAYRRRYPTLTI